jgi:hypothetical protein
MQAQCDPNYLPGPTMQIAINGCVYEVEWCYNPTTSFQYLFPSGSWHGVRIGRIKAIGYGENCNLDWNQLRDLAIEKIYTDFTYLFDGDPLKPCDDPYNDPQDIYVTTKDWRLGAGKCYVSTGRGYYNGVPYIIYEPCVANGLGVCWRYYKICWEYEIGGTRKAKVVEVIDVYNDPIGGFDECPPGTQSVMHQSDFLRLLEENNGQCYFWCN